MVKKILKSLDYSVLIICVILFAIGLVALFSANGGFQGDFAETQKQMIWFIIGFITMITIIFVDYEIIGKFWIPIFIITTISLIAVLFTEPINGATSWFNFGSVSLQPSEIAKISLILGLRKNNRKIQSKADV